MVASASIDREGTELARVREARRLIERMRDRLLQPSFQALEICAADLAAAAACIRRLDAASAVWKGPQRKALEAEVVELRRGIRCVEALLAQAGAFYAGWARMLAPDQGPPNYDAGGSLAEPGTQEQPHSTRLVMHG